MLRLGISLALVSLILAVAVPGFVAVNRTDLADPNDSDLGLHPAEAELGAAGFEAVERAAALLAEGKDRQAVAALAKVEVVDLSRAAEADLGDLHRAMQSVVELSGEQALASVEHHRADTAIGHAMLGMRLGRALTRANNGATGMMFAAVYQAAALETLESVIRRVKMPTRRADALVRELEAARWTIDDWRRAWAFEYQEMKAVFESVDLEAEMRAATGDGGLKTATYGLLPPEYLWQPNRTMALSADLFRERQRNAARACAPRIAKRPRELLPLLTAFGPNAIGNILIDFGQPRSERFDEQRCHLETRISLVQTLAAVKAYSDANGRLPKRFTELVPDRLPDLPMDAFRDAPLRYSAKQERVWSLGSDFKPGPDSATDPSDAMEPAISLVF